MEGMTELNIEELLLKYDLIRPEDAASIRLESLNTGWSFKDLVLERGIVSDDALFYAVSVELGIPFVTLDPDMIDREVARTVPRDILEKYTFLPLINVDGEVRVAVADPTDPALDRVIGEAFPGKTVGISVALPTNILHVMETIFSEPVPDAGTEQIQAPAIAILYAALADAVAKGASSLYFESVEGRIRIRKRVKGRLLEGATHPVAYMGVIIEKLRSMAGMTQETSGSVRTRIAYREVFITVSIIGDMSGWGGIVQFRYPGKIIPLGKFPLAPEQLPAINRAIWAGKGLILVTGRDRGLREALAHSIIMECNPLKRKVVALLREEDYLPGMERYVVRGTDALNGVAESLLGASADAIYIEDIRREGTKIDTVLQLAENAVVVASLSTPAGKDGIAYIERHTPGLSAENRHISLVIGTEKTPVPCGSCSVSVHGLLGKGCRRCGYSGIAEFTETITLATY